MATIVSRVEQHGCIVCGKTHNLKVTYDARNKLVACLVTSLGGRRVFDADRPLVACDAHSATEIQSAYATRYPGGRDDKDDEEDD